MLYTLVFTLAGGVITNADAPATLPSNAAQSGSLDPARQWALAASAILCERNGGSHLLLGEVEKDASRHIPAFIRDLRTGPWLVGNRQDLFDRLSWVDEAGQRKEFDDLGKIVSSLSAEGFDQGASWCIAGRPQEPVPPPLRARALSETWQRRTSGL